MTTSIYNRQRRRKFRAERRAQKRRERHTQGDYVYSSGWDHRDGPNRQRDTWHQSKDRR